MTSFSSNFKLQATTGPVHSMHADLTKRMPSIAQSLTMKPGGGGITYATCAVVQRYMCDPFQNNRVQATGIFHHSGVPRAEGSVLFLNLS